MEDSKLNELLERYRTGKATPEDKAFLESWYLSHNQSSPFIMSDEERLKDVDKVWAILEKDLGFSQKNDLWYRIAVAASILIFLSIGSFFLLHQKKQVLLNNIAKNALAPGKNMATLTLANGKKVILGNTVNGKLASEAGVTISKTKNGELVYTAHAATAKDESQFNTLETSKGEQYQVVLPDGSHVWLNAASSLKYPVVFAGKERIVELSGEGYFEVAHNKAMPFKVISANQTIEVLGTHFNVMAYPDEKAIKTTLLEGSVKVSNRSGSKMLIPGQQSQVVGGSIDVVNNVDLEDVVAWKNGYFKFNENLECIMSKISRWYNVDVVYQGKPDPKLFFGGKISRTRDIAEVLKIMEYTGNVHFKIEGRRIIVMQ